MKTFFALFLSCPLLAAPLDIAQVGFHMEVLGSGEEVVSEQADKAFVPASVMKLWTAAAALERLGPDHTFVTELITRAPINEQTIHGHLYLRGGGDPALTRANLDQMADQLRARGIRRIAGHLIADDTLFIGPHWGSDWAWEDLLEEWAPRITALSIDGTQPQPTLYTAYALKDALERRGITLEGKVVRGPLGDAPWRSLASCHSPTVSELVDQMQAVSDNAIAEYLWRHLGTEKSEAGGRDAANAFATEVVGIEAGHFVFMGGSGLSRRTLVTPRQIVTLLQAMAENPHFRGSLPTVGETQAKTGTMSGIKSLAGYATTADGRPVAFCLIINGAPLPKDELIAMIEEKVTEALNQ